MSFRLPIFRLWCGLAVLAIGGLLAHDAQAGGREKGHSIEFSRPSSGDVTTNLDQGMNPNDRLKQLEEDLYQPQQSFAPKSSLEGVLAPVPRPAVRPVIPSKRAKELLERQRDWIFMAPEDMIGGPTSEDVLQRPGTSPDDQGKQDLSPLERYYLRLATKPSSAKSPDQTKDDDLLGTLGKTNPGDQIAPSDESDLPAGVRNAAEALKSLFQSDSSASPYLPGTTSGDTLDAFGARDPVLSPAEVAHHKKLMDQYNLILDPGWKAPTVADLGSSPVAAGVLNPLATPANPMALAPAAPTALGSSSLAVSKSPIEQQWNTVSPILGPKGLPDVNAQALGQTRPAPVFPTVETPKVVAPTFTAPRRAF